MSATIPFYVYLDKEIKKATRSANMIDRFSKMYQYKLNRIGKLSDSELNTLFELLQKECKKIKGLKSYGIGSRELKL